MNYRTHQLVFHKNADQYLIKVRVQLENALRNHVHVVGVGQIHKRSRKKS